MKRILLISILLGFGAINVFPQDSIVSIPDTAFHYALIEEGVDTNGDSLISYAEAAEVISLEIRGPINEKYTIKDLTGIEAFQNLTILVCLDNEISSLDLSANRALMAVECGNNRLSSLDVSGCGNIVMLACYDNSLSSLDISANTALESVEAGNNKLTSLDLSANNALTSLECFSNQLTGLDVSANPFLYKISCSENHLTNLDISANVSLELLFCGNNLISDLDVSSNVALRSIICSGNPIQQLDLSKNVLLKIINIENIPGLHEVCVWTTPFPPDGISVEREGSPNVCFETDCNGVCENTRIGSNIHSGLSIYPNPTGDFLTIDTELPGHQSISLYSINCQMIHCTEIEGTTHQIDLSTFEKGVYIITIRSKDFVTTRKIIKL